MRRIGATVWERDTFIRDDRKNSPVPDRHHTDVRARHHRAMLSAMRGPGLHMLVLCLAAAGCGSNEAEPHGDAGAANDAVASDAASDASPDSAADAANEFDTGVPVYDGPAHLSETGLYSDFVARTVAADVLPYNVRYELWSDGAEKARWLHLPLGTQVDTSEMNRWAFPVGTKVWKEFRVAGVPVETRLLEKRHDGEGGWLMIAFVWRADGSDADAAPLGQVDAGGTPHDVPAQTDCVLCHQEKRAQALGGWSFGDVLNGVAAIQLSAEGGNGSLSLLASRGLLSAPPSGEFEVPGTGVVKAALGYLHANCGHCHDDLVPLSRSRQLRFRLRVTDTTPETTKTYQTTIGVAAVHTELGFDGVIVVPGDPDHSQLYQRISSRGATQMPPLATEVVDPTGSATIRDWIAGLPP